MAFVSPADALAYVDRVDADVRRLADALNTQAPVLDPFVISWKKWRREWQAFWLLTKQSGAVWNTVAVFEETERREQQLVKWYSEARSKGWIVAGPSPVGPPGEAGVPALSSLLLVAALAAGAFVAWKVVR